MVLMMASILMVRRMLLMMWMARMSLVTAVESAVVSCSQRTSHIPHT